MALFADPDRNRALCAYGALAQGYEASSHRILGIRDAAIAALDLQPGETVFDVACGTGATFPMLCRRVGPEGWVAGIEQAPQMAALARERLASCECRGILIEAGAQDFATDLRADAMLFTYTHDVLQSPQALHNLIHYAKPGCRVAVAGVRFLPWSWGLAVNAVTAWRTRRYLTTYRGLREPWRGLAAHCDDFRILRTFHCGSSYLGAGRLR